MTDERRANQLKNCEAALEYRAPIECFNNLQRYEQTNKEYLGVIDLVGTAFLEHSQGDSHIDPGQNLLSLWLDYSWVNVMRTTPDDREVGNFKPGKLNEIAEALGVTLYQRAGITTE